MVVRGFDGTALKRIAACAAATLAVAIALSRGDATGNPAQRAVQTLLEAIFDAVTPPALVPPQVDLNDGRSAVPARWRPAIEAFARRDLAQAPAAGGTVFIGSSSISRWHSLETQFPGRNLVRRGLGGARMADCAYFVDRLVLPYQPRTVVVYAGDNDLAEGVTPAAILANYIDLVRQVHGRLPRTRVVFVSVKPSPARASLLEAARHTNALVADYSHSDSRLDYIDIFTPMLGADGQARPGLFEPDALHPNAAGYTLWARALAGHLD